ncbi:MAG TPA: TonB-dependent receptor [Povalibacter sp.]|nr:TonB-dependent receptor [Povalibacter sp.]
MLSRSTWLAVAVSTALSAASAAETATATTRQFSIPAQPIAAALRQYAEKTGDQIVFFSEVGSGRESSGVEGQYTSEEALQRLLDNTGLKARRINSRTISIGLNEDSGVTQQETLELAALEPLRLAQAAPVTPPPAAPAGTLSTQAAQQAQGQGSLFGVEEVVVTGTAVSERTKFDSSVAISTFDTDAIAQQAPASSADLIAAVPGFWVESTSGTTQGNVFARGIIQDGGYKYVGLMEDGIPIYPVSELSFYNPDQFVRVDETIERVEALRGGTAPIFTPGAIGGVINFVTRSPSNEPQGVVKVGISDYSLYRGDFAWSGPVSDNLGLAFGGYYRQSDGIRDPGYSADQGGQFRLKLLWNFEAGELELFGKYINDRSLFAVPIPLQGNPSDPDAINGQDAGTYSLHSEDLVRAGLPASAAQLGLQGSNLEDGIHPDLTTIGARLRWGINDMLTLTNLARYTDGSVRFDGIFSGDAPTRGTDFAADHQVAPNYTVLTTGEPYAADQFVQNQGHWVVNKDYQAFQDDIRLGFDLGANNLTLGAYFADYSMKDRWSLGNLILMDVRDRPRRLSLAGATDPNGFTQYSTFNLLADYDATAYALYASDEWQVTDALRLDFGLRYDNEDIDATLHEGAPVDLDGNPATPWDNTASQISAASRRINESYDTTGWSVGFNYELTPHHAFFGHYTDSERLPNFDDLRNATQVNGRPQVEPDSVTNIELGYKTSLENFVLFATLFQTEFDNIVFRDILANGDEVRRTAGTRTRGIELEGEWLPMEAFNIRFNLTWQDPKYTDFNGSTAGPGGVLVPFNFTDNTIRRIPEVMGRITPTYYFMESRGRVYLTYTYVGKRFSNDENTVELPSYNKFDAGVMFDISDALSVQVSGDNLTDEVGLTEGNPRTDIGATGIGAIYMARPLFGRSFMASATYKF